MINDYRDWKTKLLSLAMTDGKFGLDHPMGSCCYRDLIRDAKSNEALKDAWERIIVKGEEPLDETTQVIKLFPQLVGKVRSGEKKATTRLGLKPYTLGPAYIQNSEDPEDKLLVEVTKLEGFLLKDLTDELAQIEGYEKAGDLRERLKEIYGDKVNDDSIMTVAYFQ